MEHLKENKDEKFRRLAEQRVNAILDKLRLLGQLSNKGNYGYTEDQVEAAFKAIQQELKTTKAKFRNGSSARKRFTL